MLDIRQRARRAEPSFPGADPEATGDEAEELDPGNGRRLLCAACREPITSEAARTSIAGRHLQRQTNPFGVRFEFGCFAAAPGAEVVGQPTAEHSWFPGYGWSFSHCGGCGAHLGWFFSGSVPAFHGLILDRLVPEE